MSRPSYFGKKTSELTDEERAQVRKEWEEAEKRVRGKPARLSFPKTLRNVQSPLFAREHCDNCKLILPYGNIRPVIAEGERETAVRFLCSKCRKDGAP